MIGQKDIVQLPAIAVLVFLASAVDLYLLAAFEIAPITGQVLVMGVLIGHLATSAIVGHLPPFYRSRSQIFVLILIAIYLAWTAFSYIYSRQVAIVTQVLIDRVRGGLFLIVIAMVLSEPRSRKIFAYAAGLLAALSALINIYDFINPTFTAVPGRAAGFYRNPNEAGFVILALTVIAVGRLPILLNYLLWALAGVGILLTFSRSAWLLMFAAVLGHALLGRLGGGRGRFVFLGVVGAVILAVFVTYLSGDLYLYLVNSPLGEFLDPNTLARVGASGAALDDFAAFEREEVFDLSIEYFLQSPIIGWGVGATHIWAERSSTHNMLGLMGAELGIVGLLLYIAIFWIIVAKTRGNARLLALLIAAHGFVTHNQLEFLTNIVLLAFCIASIEMTQRRQTIAPSFSHAPKRIFDDAIAAR